MSEQKVVKCPRGHEMEPVARIYESETPNAFTISPENRTARIKYIYYYRCDCGWESPKCSTHDVYEVQGARDEAYRLATITPLNLPLTLPDLFSLTVEDAVWVVTKDGRILAMSAEEAQEWADEDGADFFARKPTNADIAAARKEQP